MMPTHAHFNSLKRFPAGQLLVVIYCYENIHSLLGIHGKIACIFAPVGICMHVTGENLGVALMQCDPHQV